MITKSVLNTLSYWQRDTWIIGSGDNAFEAYKAISSERNLGLNIVGFIASEGGTPAGEYIEGIGVLSNDINWLATKDKRLSLLLQLNLIKVKCVILGCVIL